MGREMVDIYCDSHDVPPDAITLDIDDTFDTAHGQQQMCPRGSPGEVPWG